MRAFAFAERNRKEILRDPLSFVFCLAFPALLLIAFRCIQYNTGDAWMSSTELIPGMAVFTLAFDMLFMALLVSKDRGSAFLARLCNTPMRVSDFILGYFLPCFALGVAQLVITYVLGAVIFLIPNGALDGGLVFLGKSTDFSVLPPVEVVTRVTVPLWGLLAAVAAALPMLCFFLFIGIFFGILLNERAAPGISSALISGSALLGGCWMPLQDMGVFETVCRFLPFYPSVTLARAAFVGSGDAREIAFSLLAAVLWALAAMGAALWAFGKKRTA